MSFTLDLQRAAKKINENTEKVVRGTIAGINRRIIQRTPVGDPDLWVAKDSSGRYVDYVSLRGYPAGYVGGSLRGAWQASIGGPTVSTDAALPDSNGAATISDANKMAMTLEIGQTYYLTNPLPYAFRVEYGWSTQAPEGMVRRSVIETQQVIDSL